ncbi:MAG: hypothetical protein CMM74_08145 [Rhodospirillaceae bacterium]|nr:hypothetical protein [Rhodospirillaceae bacterium]
MDKFTPFSLLVATFWLAVAVPPLAAQEKNMSPKPHIQGLNAQQKKEVEQVIGGYLRQNPEIIAEAIRILQDRERSAKQNRVLHNLVANKDRLLNDPTSPIGGNPKGDITVVEFFDYNCGFCKKMFPAVQKLLKDDKNIRYVFKEFPILSPSSETAARVALVAWKYEKEKYFDFHRRLIEAKGSLSNGRIFSLAAKSGLDVARLKKQMGAPDIAGMINVNRELAEKLDIRGTPGFVIGNQIIPGAIDLATLKQLIKEAREG